MALSLIMNKVLVSGDSWTSGWPLEETQPREQFTWPNIVAKHFDAQLVDTSRAGSSNYRIYRKAVEGILDDSIDTVLVFLSSWRFISRAMSWLRLNRAGRSLSATMAKKWSRTSLNIRLGSNQSRGF